MTINDPRFNKTLNQLDVPGMPAGMVARLSHIANRPQARGLTAILARLIPLEDLIFALRYDIRYQAAAAALMLTLSVGTWQGLQLTHTYSNMAAFSDEAAASIAADPVISGAL
jgi:hypothetical protein